LLRGWRRCRSEAARPRGRGKRRQVVGLGHCRLAPISIRTSLPPTPFAKPQGVPLNPIGRAAVGCQEERLLRDLRGGLVIGLVLRLGRRVDPRRAALGLCGLLRVDRRSTQHFPHPWADAPGRRVEPGLPLSLERGHQLAQHGIVAQVEGVRAFLRVSAAPRDDRRVAASMALLPELRCACSGLRNSRQYFRRGWRCCRNCAALVPAYRDVPAYRLRNRLADGRGEALERCVVFQ
jgi:hypothetical protein